MSFGGYILVCLVIAVVGGIFGGIQESKKREKKDAEIAEKRKRKREQYEADVQDMRNRYGNESFDYGELFDAYNRVFVFPEKRVVVYHKSPVEFDKIIAFDVTDNKTSITTSEAGNATTKTSTGSMLGRAVVGGVLAGGVGAAIGGSTAKRHTDIQPGLQTTNTSHDYKVYLTINDFKNPSLCIPFGDNTEAVHRFVSYLNIILRDAAQPVGRGPKEAQ